MIRKNIILIGLTLIKLFSCANQQQENSVKEHSNHNYISEQEQNNVEEEKRPKDTFISEIAGTYIFQSIDGISERLFISNQGKKIEYNSSKNPDKILLELTNEFKQTENKYLISVNFPGSSAQIYTIEIDKVTYLLTCHNPDSTIQTFVKKIANLSHQKTVMGLIFLGQQLEAINQYGGRATANKIWVKDELNTKVKMTHYLSQFYTHAAIEKFLSYFEESQGKLMFTPWMGGDINDYSRAKLKLIQGDHIYKTYLLTVPSVKELGHSTPSTYKIQLQKNHGKWYLDDLTGIGYGIGR